jgi:hypothetical protein
MKQFDISRPEMLSNFFNRRERLCKKMDEKLSCFLSLLPNSSIPMLAGLVQFFAATLEKVHRYEKVNYKMFQFYWRSKTHVGVRRIKEIYA